MIRCFYHGADFDGICSGAIVKYTIPDAMMYPIDYGQPFPWHEIQANDIVYMVDFSLCASDMAKLSTMCTLTWIDHHATAINAYETMGKHISGIRVTTSSACQITWEYFRVYPEPRSVTLLGRYDIWDHDDDVLDFQYGMLGKDLQSIQPGTEFWEDLFENLNVDLTILRGRVIRTYQEQQDAKYVAAYAFEKDLFGKYKTICCSRGMTSSKLFDSVVNREHYDLMCWFVTIPDGRWRVTLATERDIDVGAICALLGGGGHLKVGGFIVDDIDMFLNKNPMIVQ